MKKRIRLPGILLGVLVLITALIYLTVFVLAKQKKIFINKWFVDEKKQHDRC